MPQRFLRPGLTTSEKWNAVSFQAQSFFVRLLTLVDDWGRFDARTPILHAYCFALRKDVKPQRTAALRSELQRADLIDVYEVSGKEYLQIKRWEERARGKASKYPDPQRVNGKAQHSAAERSEAQEKDASLAIAITPSPSPLHPRAAAREVEEKSSLSALEDTTRFVCSGICGKKRPRLSGEAEHALSDLHELLPLTAEQKELLTWWLQLPEEDDAWLKSRPKDPNKLAIRLFDELDRAEAHRQKSGAQISSKKTAAAKTEPDAWREWCNANGYPIDPALHPSYWALPESVRSAFELWRSGQ